MIDPRTCRVQVLGDAGNGHGEIFFGRKLKGTLKFCQQAQKGVLDKLQLPIEPTQQLPHGPSCRPRIAGMNQVGHRLGLIQTESSVEKRAAGEFSRGRGAGARGTAGGHRLGGDDTSAVAEKLHRIFARIAAGGQQRQGQNAVDHVLARFEFRGVRVT